MRLPAVLHGVRAQRVPEATASEPYPTAIVSFPDFTLTAAQWDALQIPVGVAFFFVNSTLEQIAAFYPSPAGATESLLPLDSWNEIVAANPELTTLRPDVEAFLVRGGEHRSGTVQALGQPERQPECFLVPIDVCYELVGELRRLWKGFDGGTEAHDALDAFFDRVRAKSQPTKSQPTRSTTGGRR